MTNKHKRVVSVSFNEKSRREFITGGRKRKDTNRVIALEHKRIKEHHIKLEKRRKKRQEEKQLVEEIERKRLMIQEGKDESGSDQDDFGFGHIQQHENDNESEEEVQQSTVTTYEKDSDSEIDGIDNITVTVKPFTFDDKNEDDDKEEKVYKVTESKPIKVALSKKEIETKIRELHKAKYNKTKHQKSSAGVTKSGKKYKKKREKIMSKLKEKKAKKAVKRRN